ncbi:MAG: S8 family peptidase [Planctomycetota bacterium]
MTRKLRFEAMEARRLLAADMASATNETIAEPAYSAEPLDFSAADFSAQASADLGSIDGASSLTGQLGWFNSYDRVGFSLERDAQVSIDVSNFFVDVNLYLTNAAGQIIASSTQAGRAAEAIDVQLPSGEYFAWTLATSYWNTPYSMQIDATLEAPPVVDLPLDEGEGGVGRLAEVDYFGGNRDWGINAIGAPEAWAAGYRGEGVTVAVVDTGVDLDHPDLVSNLFVNPGEIPGNGIDDDANGFIDDVHGYDFADGDANPNDVNGHGTHVAGTIAAADNGFGATGVAPDATILPIKVLGDNGSGRSSSVAAGIRYAADLGADIINLSLGGGYSSAIESAIRYAEAAGSFIVAAAGNEAAAVPGFPARFSSSYENVISVGAHDRNGQVAGFSNDVGNSGALQVDAPGVGVYSTYAGGGFATLSGTSMAAPHVAGLAALSVSANPSLTATQLRNVIAGGVIGDARGSDAIGLASTLDTVARAATGVDLNTSFGSGLSSSGLHSETNVAVNPGERYPVTQFTASNDESSANDRVFADWTGDELESSPKIHSFARASVTEAPIDNPTRRTVADDESASPASDQAIEDLGLTNSIA